MLVNSKIEDPRLEVRVTEPVIFLSLFVVSTLSWIGQSVCRLINTFDMTKDGFQRRQQEKQKRMIEEACAYFPIKRTRQLLQEYSSAEHVTFKAGIAMASALSNITAELCLVAGDCSKKNLVAWQGNGRIIEAKHIRKANKEEPKLASIMSILSARDRTPKWHLIVKCDQVRRVNACCWSIGSSIACAINDDVLQY
eukprot:5283-Heterococcus_DN1.PRE.2